MIRFHIKPIALSILPVAIGLGCLPCQANSLSPTQMKALSARIPPPLVIVMKTGIVDGWRVVWKKSQTTFAAGQPMVLIFELENVSDNPQHIAISSAPFQCPIDVKNSKGQEVPRSLRGRVAIDPSGSLFLATVQPKHAIEYVVNLGTMFDLSLDGTYFVTASRLLEGHQEKNQAIAVASEPLSFTIRSPIALYLNHIDVPSDGLPEDSVISENKTDRPK